MFCRLILLSTLAVAPAFADAPMVTDAVARDPGAGWRFDVSLRHPDIGWSHYADGWRIETPEGEVLGTRRLLHPHETEQPFTRSLGSVDVPDGLSKVRVRASCNKDGWSEEAAQVTLPR